MMKFKVYILFVSLLCLSNNLLGQGQAGVWYFGRNAGLNFNENPSVALTDGSLNTEEGCATVCTAQGDLLFYTDGVTVYNKNHAIMTNGTGLGGNFSATQSSVIVQQPGSPVLYYIFTVDAHQNALSNGFQYSTVDMSRDGGLGEVVTKNQVVYSGKVCEKITAVAHANGTDYWIIMHLWNSDDFYAYHLTSGGLSAPVISSVGSVHNGNLTSAVGYMKTSPAGDKIALAIFTDDLIELFDYNPSTGLVSNPIQLANYKAPYGVEFSPSGNILYVSLYSLGELHQFDISSKDQATILASDQIIGNESAIYGALQLGPDNKIYMAKLEASGAAGSLNLDVINEPNVIGVGADFTANGKNLGGQRCFLGLPNFVTSIFILSFSYANNCIGDDTEFTITSDLTNIASATWTFGDGTSTTSNTSPFTVTHQYGTTGTYTVNLEVNWISGGADNISQDIDIVDGPVANDQTPSVWEDVAGSGSASGVDLTLQEAAINGSAGINYSWYSDAGLTTEVPDPTNVVVTNGQQFWVEVGNGSCKSVAVVTYTVNSLPMALDQNPVECEDSYGSGIASNIDLTTLEAAINNGSGLPVNWFHNIGLTNPVTNPANRIVSDGEIFYAEVVSGTESSVATVTFTILSLPEGNDITIQVWEDDFGSGIATGIDLTSHNNAVGGANQITWYFDDALTNLVTTPENLTVSDGDVFYALIEDGSCSNRGSVTFIVRSSPIANDLTIEVCEDVFGGGTKSNVDLTALDGAINGGTGSSVSWYSDETHTVPVDDPSSVTVSDGQSFYVLVKEGGESNSAIITYNVLSLPAANSLTITEFEDVEGSGIAQAVDLTTHNDAVLGGSSNSLEWYSDPELLNLVPDPTNQDVANGDIFYALVSDAVCTNVATLEFLVINTPVARDVYPEVCEDTEGSGSAVVDLTTLENQINEGNGDTFNWYFDWPTEPTGLPVNLIPDPTNVIVNNGDRFFATVSDLSNTNVASVNYSVNQLPVANDIVIDVWEDTFGSGEASGINLLNYNSQINSNTGVTVSWYEDAALTTPVLTPDNLIVSDGDMFYAMVDDGTCQNSGIVTMNVRPLPEANDLLIQLCEDVQGTSQVSGYDLTQLEPLVNNDPGTTIEWYFDVAASLPVSNPDNQSVKDEDVFYAKVSFGGESNVGQVEFEVNPVPIVNDHAVTLCENVINTGIVKGEDLTSHESEITSAGGINIIWYHDITLLDPVVNSTNVQVANGDIFYARAWDGTCENIAQLTYTILALPQVNSITEVLCEDSFGTGLASGVDLLQFQSRLSVDTDVSFEWYEDDQLRIPIGDPTNISVGNQSNYYAVVTNSNSCQSVAALNFLINSLPEANNLTVDLCEDENSELRVTDYDLTSLESQITSSVGANVFWYEDVELLSMISNPNSYTVTNNMDLFVRVESGDCSNMASMSFVVNENPAFDLGRDTSIFYTESLLLDPVIDAKFTPGTYLWQDGSTTSSYLVTQEGMYTLEYTDLNKCTGRDSVMIYVEKYRIFVPNAFTPDGDGVNDVFGPVITGDITGQDIEMYIYNRWGELIYEFTDFGNGWDGTYKGRMANTGVYVWVMIINGKAKQDGTVSLIR
eukprot:TRINITY_DN107_c0_g4_i3.p1 TRINITY_DN107_c0_g4~~TRINITY_DN107_c0_g4_i3.p1  ORF type:complete len:1593 (-),score=279.76 TRINITY_DN107_c0_g4_i3:4486-9264(-)